jgi:uncharacterized protein (DUF1499 family)
MTFRSACVGIAVVSLALLLLSGPGTRIGWFGFRTGLQLLAGSAIVAIGAFSLSVVGLMVPRLRGGEPFPLVVGLLLSVIAMVAPALFIVKARSVPSIHDITTDTQNPPPFVDVIPLRQATGATNPPEYAGAAAAALQKEAYPDIVPLELAIPANEAFTRAAEAARSTGWDLVSENAGDLRIEATDTTMWFGFRDDIVIRVTPSAAGSRIDVRSKSRVGRSDVGKNAARIRAYLGALRPS